MKLGHERPSNAAGSRNRRKQAPSSTGATAKTTLKFDDGGTRVLKDPPQETQYFGPPGSFRSTYCYDRGGKLARKGSDERGWLVCSSSEDCWELPDSTHVGGIGSKGDLVVITFFLKVNDGAIEHIQNDASVNTPTPDEYDRLGGKQIHQALGKLCSDLWGRKLTEIRIELPTRPRKPIDPYSFAPAELARLAFLAALSNTRFREVRAPQNRNR